MSGSHRHNHSHDHDHDHVPSGDISKQLVPAFVLTFGFMIVEFAGGLISGSLALIADAGHMLTDAGALALAIVGVRLASRPSDHKRTYGYGRSQVLAAFGNALALIGVTVWIFYEAVTRFFEPTVILAGPMLWVAIIGLLVNIVVFAILHRGDRDNMNLQGAWLHVVGDMLGSVGAILAALIIMWTGWTPIDPILSVLMAGLILGGALRLLKRSTHILLEGSPHKTDKAQVISHLLEHVQGLEDVHHVHMWMLTENEPLITLHARLVDDADPDRVLQQIKHVLSDEFGLDHATVQIERGDCPDEKRFEQDDLSACGATEFRGI